MKQVILLEPREVDSLQRGKAIEITVPGGVVMVRFDLNGSWRHASVRDDLKTAQCGKCGKVLKNALGLRFHMSKMHTHGGKMHTHGGNK